MNAVKKYLSLIKFSHTIFAMPFALIGFCLGVKSLQSIPLVNIHSSPFHSFSQKLTLFFYYKWHLFILVLLCMIFARSAAMAFNRFLDRSFDAKNPRTAIREIPAGIVKANHALLFTLACSILFILCSFLINTLCFYLSPIALLVVLGYSYTKRFTPLCHLVLGLGLALAPIGAYLAVTGVFHFLPILFSLSVICWVSGFDIIYALQDVDFDKSQNLYSIPVLLGKKRALNVSKILHAVSAIALVSAGFLGQFGLIYWVGVSLFIGMLIYQHRIVKPNDLSKVNIAFMTANGIASIVFAAFTITDLYLH